MATTEKFIAEFSVQGTASLDAAKDKIQSLNDKVNGLATAILGVGFGAFIHGAMQAADRISDFSDATNISISSIKAFGAALDEAGGKASNTEKIVNAFYAAIDNANQGSLATRDAFKEVGVSIKDLGTLTETELLNKTLAGLAKLPPGAERAAVATQLLSRAFRSVDPKAFQEALDPAKFLETEEATKKAAAQVQKMEETFRTLQEGALAAMEPILKLMGETKLTTETATKVVQILGIAIAGAFGLSVLTNIIAVSKALAEFNIVSKAGLAIDIAKQALQGPKGWAILAGAAVATGAAIYGLNKLLGDTGETAKDTAKEVAAVTGAAGVKPGGKLTEATPTAGNAKRKQELDSRQRAELESNKKIAQSIADQTKEIELRTASDLEKIDIESTANKSKAKIEIFAKENLSRQQKEKEYQAAARSIDEKATTDKLEVQRQQEAQLQQQKMGYSQANAQLLGYEQSELSKVNDLIAQQPLKYKEIGDQLRANASQQDVNLITLKKFIEEQTRLKALLQEQRTIEISFETEALKYKVQRERSAEIMNASSEKERQLIELKNSIIDKTIAKEEALTTFKEYQNALMVEGDDLSMKQSQAIADHLTNVEMLTDHMKEEMEVRQADLALLIDHQRTFEFGWKKAFDSYADNASNSAKIAGDMFNAVTSNMNSAIDNFVENGKFSFGDLATSIIKDLLKIELKASALAMFTAGKTALAGAGGIGGLFSGLGSLFGFANGGATDQSPMIVGERGPELFIPGKAGSIVPNNQLGQQQIVNNNQFITNNVSAIDAKGVAQLFYENRQTLFGTVEQAKKELPFRGAMA